MQILLASAKIMKERCRSIGLVPGTPRFQDSALMLASDMKHLNACSLSELFSCSLDIAGLNHDRFEVFGTDEAEIMPAVLSYYGQAYKHLRADLMDVEDLLWADSHLWISSCLYGLLRPLDGINTYRMEGGFPLPCTKGKKVHEFWRAHLTGPLVESVLSDDGVLVYLDTEEFRTLFDWKLVQREVPVIIEPEFHVLKNGRMTSPSVWAKTCRGAMTRFIIENRIEDPEKLKEFRYEGFSYKETGDSRRMIFIRE